MRCKKKLFGLLHVWVVCKNYDGKFLSKNPSAKIPQQKSLSKNPSAKIHVYLDLSLH